MKLLSLVGLSYPSLGASEQTPGNVLVSVVSHTNQPWTINFRSSSLMLIAGERGIISP